MSCNTSNAHGTPCTVCSPINEGAEAGRGAGTASSSHGKGLTFSKHVLCSRHFYLCHLSQIYFVLPTSGKEPGCQCRRCKRHEFSPWVGKSPWRRSWQPTPVFLPGEAHEYRSLAGYSPQCRQELDRTETS